MVWFERYEILEILGKGGEGTVFLAKDIQLQRKVALKIIENVTDDYSREIEIFKQLKGPLFPVLYDAWQKDGQTVLVMEYIDGTCMKEYLEKEPLPEQKVYEYGEKIAEGLLQFHKRDLLYRDLKPENLMIEKDGTIRLLDFGAAIGKQNVRDCIGKRIGTYGYASPEQWQGKRISESSDVYAMGAVLYDLLAFPLKENMHAGVRSNLRHCNRAVPYGMNYCIMKCLEYDRNNRYATVDDFVKDWRNYKLIGFTIWVRDFFLKICRYFFLLGIAALLFMKAVYGVCLIQNVIYMKFTMFFLTFGYFTVKIMEYIAFKACQYYTQITSVWMRAS